jgi:MSHA pilin protein MshA
MNTTTMKQQGFTLIEVVMIIVILGILAAVAIPRFINLAGNEQQAAVRGVAGALGSASSTNYSGCSKVANAVTPGKCVTIAKCSDIATTIVPTLVLGAAGDAVANSYNVLVDTPAVGNGTETTCTLQYLKNGMTYTATYVVTGAGQ